MKPFTFNRRQSLEQLEKKFRTDGDFPTPLVEKVYQYRKIPVGDLSTEQLRLLIGQDEGLIYLIPLAIEKLKTNIFAEGDLYEGDLLSAVLSSDRSFWSNHSHLHQEMETLFISNKNKIEEAVVSKKWRRLPEAIEAFRNIKPFNP